MKLWKQLGSLAVGAALTVSALALPSVAPPAQARVVVEVGIGAPPPPRFERRPYRPWRNAVWIDGHWGHRYGRWEWISGHWARPYGRYSGWVPGHYDRRGDWIEGHWR
jgi:hypothetical protein